MIYFIVNNLVKIINQVQVIQNLTMTLLKYKRKYRIINNKNIYNNNYNHSNNKYNQIRNSPFYIVHRQALRNIN